MRRALPFVFASLLAGCSLLFDGSDLRGDAGRVLDARAEGGSDARVARDAGRDASVPVPCDLPCGPTQCCLGDTCMPIDQDEDGYPRAACAPDGATVDCDDTDPNTTPWPPMIGHSLREHDEVVTVLQLDVAAVDETCGLAAFLSSDTNPNVVIDRAADSPDSCEGANTYPPRALPCASLGAFERYTALDMRRPESTTYLTVAGDCMGRPTLRTFELRGASTAGALELEARTEVVEVELVADPIPSAFFVRRAGTAVGRVGPEMADTQFLPLSISGIQSNGLLGAMWTGNIAIGEMVGAGGVVQRDVPGMAGRPSLVYFPSTTRYIAIAPVIEAGSTVLRIFTPFTAALSFVESATVDIRWIDDGAFDPLVDAAAIAGERFAVVGRTATGINVRLGRVELGTGAIAIDAGEWFLPVTTPTLLRDVAIDVSDVVDARASIFVAAGDAWLRSARLTVCLEGLEP